MPAIQFLDSSAYGGAVRAPAKHSRGINPLFRGRVSVDGQSSICYIKPAPDTIRATPNLELVGEAIGFVLAKGSDLCVPKVAGVIELTRDQIPSAVLDQLAAKSCGAIQDTYLSWFSEDMVYPSIKQAVTSSIPQLQERRLKRTAKALERHPDVPAIISFDEYLTNTDRNLGNLLRTATNRLMLIDHGRLFGTECWTPSTLNDGSGINVLDEFLSAHVLTWRRNGAVKSKRAIAYNKFRERFGSSVEEQLRAVLLAFFGDADAETIVQHIWRRLDPQRCSHAIGQLNV